MARKALNDREVANQLRTSALGLEVGGTTYEVACPACGRSSSFSVTRTSDGLLYNCFRNVCGIRGFVPSFSNAIYRSYAHPRKTRPFSYDTRQLLAEELDFLCNKYHLGSWTYLSDVLAAPTIGRLIYPIRGHRRYETGVIARYHPELEIANQAFKTESKALIYPLNDTEPLAHWEVDTTSKTVIVVEDWMSARKLSVAGYNAVALLGTHLSEDLVFLLKDYTIVICLDNDATLKASLLAKKFSLVCDISSLEIHRDFKDQTVEEVRECLKSIK